MGFLYYVVYCLIAIILLGQFSNYKFEVKAETINAEDGPIYLSLSKTNEKYKDGVPALKAAYAEEGVYVGADQLEALANIKSKNEVIADIVALLQSPAKNVISALQSGGNTIHGVLKTLGERAE